MDDIADDLLRAEDEARLAAEAAGRTAAGLPDHDADEMPPVLSEGLEGAVGESPSAELSSVSVISDSPFDQASGAGEPTARKETHPFAARSLPTPESRRRPQTVILQVTTANGVGHDRQVEDLFARLRASSLGDGPGSSDAGDAGDAGGTTRAAGPSISSDSTSESPRGGAAPSAIAEASAPASADSDDEPTLELSAPVQLVRRDELLGPVIAGLARRVKRALQDDQNDILDRLRSQGGWKDGVLPELSEHTARYVEASKEMLAEAARAGCHLRGLSIETRRGRRGLRRTACQRAGRSRCGAGSRRTARRSTPQTTPLWSSTSGPHFANGAETELRGSRGTTRPPPSQRRPWPGPRSDVTIRWIVDDEGAPCADCEDNALAEDVSPGDPFPTGHLHPPAHSGCRCLLVVTERPRLPTRAQTQRHPASGAARDPTARGHRRSGIWIIVAIVVIIVLLASLRTLATFYTDYLWFASVHQPAVWRGMLGVKLGLFLVFAAVFFVVLWVQPGHRRPYDPEHADARPRRRARPQVPAHRLPRAFLVRTIVSIVIALIAASSTIGEWQNWMLYIHGVPFGVKDPQFGTRRQLVRLQAAVHRVRRSAGSSRRSW